MENERPSLDILERGMSGEEPWRLMIVGDNVSGRYCGTLKSRVSERRASEDAEGQAWWLDVLLEVCE